MSLLGCLKALCEGLIGSQSERHPVGMAQVQWASNDELLNQLGQPLHYINKQPQWTSNPLGYKKLLRQAAPAFVQIPPSIYSFKAQEPLMFKSSYANAYPKAFKA